MSYSFPSPRALSFNVPQKFPSLFPPAHQCIPKRSKFGIFFLVGWFGGGVFWGFACLFVWPGGGGGDATHFAAFPKPGHPCTFSSTERPVTVALKTTAPRDELVQTRPSDLCWQEGAKPPLHIVCPINESHTNTTPSPAPLQNSINLQHPLPSFWS